MLDHVGMVEPLHRSRYRTALWCACTALVMMALSVSLSQIFMALTIISFVVEWALRRKQYREAGPTTSPWNGAVGIPLVAAFLFSWLFLSTFFHMAGAPNPGTYFIRALRSELGDFWIYLFGMVVFALARDPGHRRSLLRALLIFAVVLVLSGAAALFTEFRLAKIVTGHGFISSPRNRPQHPLGLSWGSIHLYQPIGFMNTRLTYAGLLIMTLPLVFGRTWAMTWKALDSFRSSRPYARSLSWAMAGLFLLGLALLVLYANRTRSAQLGLGAATGFAFFMYVSRRMFESPSLRPVLLILASIFIACGGLAWVHRAEVKPRVDGILARNIRFTDAFRPIIWTGTGALIRENPVMGTGPGNYPAATRTWRESFAREHPTTWYFTNNAPDGHAHNDILHLGAVGGLPAALAFLILMFLSLHALALARTPSRTDEGANPPNGLAPYLFCGMVALFPAGLFQCYFQDDEVVVLFWVLAALALRSSANASATMDTPTGQA